MTHDREAAILNHRLGEKLRTVLQEFGGYVAGGAVTSIFRSRPIQDFDLFFRDADSLKPALGRLRELADDGSKIIETDAAISVTIDAKRVQGVRATSGDPQHVIQSFDFTICQAAFVPDYTFIFGPRFMQHLAQRRLVFNLKAEYPICSLFRARKFIKRGFDFPGIEAIKLGLSIQKLQISTYSDLKKQLMGIDTLFLAELTRRLEEEGAKQYDLAEFLDMLYPYIQELESLTGYEGTEEM